jgi:hypothetical protein
MCSGTLYWRGRDNKPACAPQRCLSLRAQPPWPQVVLVQKNNPKGPEKAVWRKNHVYYRTNSIVHEVAAQLIYRWSSPRCSKGGSSLLRDFTLEGTK